MKNIIFIISRFFKMSIIKAEPFNNDSAFAFYLIVFCKILIHKCLESKHISGGVENFYEVTRLTVVVLTLKEVLQIVLRSNCFVGAEIVSLTLAGKSRYCREAHLRGNVSC